MFKLFWAAPVFADHEKTRVASLLNTILLACLVILGLLFLVMALAGVADEQNLVVVAVTAALLLPVRALMQRGQVRWASVLLATIIVVNVSIAIYFAGTIRDPVTAGYLAAIIGAGLLLGTRAAFGFTVLSGLLLLGLLQAELAGRLREVPFTVGLADWFAYMAMFSAVITMVSLAIRSINQGLEHSRQQARQQAAIAKLGQCCLATTNEAALMQEAVSLVAQTLAAPYVGIFELTADRNVLRLRTGVGWDQAVLDQATLPANAADQAAGRALRANEPVVVEADSARTRSAPAPLLQRHQIVSSVTVAIRGQARPFGVLAAYCTRPRRFSPDEVDFLQAIANVLASIMDLLHAEIEVAQRKQDLLVLQSAGTAITSSLDLAEVLQSVAKAICHWLDVASCSISEWNPAAETIKTMVDYGPAGWTDRAQEMDQDFGLAGYPLTRQVLLKRSPQQLVIDQSPIDPAELDFMQQIGARTLLMVPMIFQNQVVGLVEIMDDWATHPFTDQEIAMAQLLANQAASAIENARLYGQVQRHAGELEQLVAARTAELMATNRKLLQEIRDRELAEVRLHQAKEAAEAANRAKGQFLANMSHELRTPLNAILGYAQVLLKDDTLSERQHESIGMLQNNGEYLLTLLNDILSLSKLEAGKLEVKMEEFSLRSFLTNLVDVFAMRAAQKGITFIFKPEANLPVVVQGDEIRLRQVLTNLLSNAVKFTDRGGVTLAVGYQAGELSFRVEDTGIGIERDHLTEIFLPFQQVGHSSSHSEGVGLGLAISQRLVVAMGGQLHVESNLGVGSIFQVDLNLPVPKSPMVAPAEGLKQRRAGQRPEPRREPAGLKLQLPPEIAGKLHEAALDGDIKEIRALIDQLESIDPQYQSLAAELRRLARAYRVKQIRDLLARRT